MAVPEQTPYKEYTANGSTTSFALGFICESKNDLIVLVDGVAPPVATWSLIGANAVFTTAPASGKKIVLQRNTAMSRTTNYQSNNNSFRPETINKDIDRVWLKLQELGVADWILSNRIDALKNYVNQQDGILQDNIDSLKNYVDDKDDELRNYLLNAIQEQGVALDQLEEYYSYLMQQLAQVAIDRGWAASFIVSADGSTQQEINDFGGAEWWDKPLGYKLGATVKLTNGDIVKSTEPNNTVNPNVDMTGWVLVNSDSAIITWSGRTQESINRDFLSVKDFGATGDGVTDDTTAIQAALFSDPLDRGGSTAGGMNRRKIYFPTGIYRVSNLKIQSNTQLVGENKFNTSLKTLNPDCTGYMIEDNGDAQKICIINMTINAQAGAYMSDDWAKYTSVLRLGHNAIQWGTEAFLENVVLMNNPGGIGYDLNGNVAYANLCVAYFGRIGWLNRGTANSFRDCIALGQTETQFENRAPFSTFSHLELEGALAGSTPFKSSSHHLRIFGLLISLNNTPNYIETLIEIDNLSANNETIEGLVISKGGSTFKNTLVHNGIPFETIHSYARNVQNTIKVNENYAASLPDRTLSIPATTSSVIIQVLGDVKEDLTIIFAGSEANKIGVKHTIINNAQKGVVVWTKSLYGEILPNGLAVVSDPNRGCPVRRFTRLDVLFGSQLTEANLGALTEYSFSGSAADWLTYPQYGYWLRGETITVNGANVSNTAPYKKVCIKSGYAIGGAWAAATAFKKGSYTTNAGKVYKAETAGTSGNTAPTHTSGIASDGVVSWKFIDVSTNMATFVDIPFVAPVPVP